MKHYQQYINGIFEDGSDHLETVNPATNEAWATAPAASEDDVNRAVAAAKAALHSKEWAGLSATARGKLLYRLADLVAERAQDLAVLETTDSGKLLAETRMQTGYVSDYYRFYAGLADKNNGHVLPIDKPDMHVFTTRVPIGVVAAIVPWNAQMFLTATKLGPALAAGNTVVLKASETAPIPMLEFARIVHDAGFPPGVVNIITGYGDPCGSTLTRHKDVAHIAFTGGPETARHIVRNTAENFAPVSLELGGKSPLIIFEDANIESAVNGIIAGNYGASGQSCVAGSRVFLHTSIHDEVIAKLEERVKDIVVGDPLDANTHMGPLATLEQHERCTAVVKESVEQGARLVYGGKTPNGKTAGHYFEPTLLVCPSQDIKSVRTECFGPVMSAIKFETEEEVIAMANDSHLGLGAGVFTNDLARAHRVTQKIHSGIIWVNTYRAISPIAPFGGFKDSGTGREAGVDSINDYTRTKTTWINTSAEPMANPFVMR
jgi:acyl-CoA reductase-like NAD-dependent aldehyde dehydrogenase